MKFTRDEPIGNTCPDIDSLISSLEDLRRSNATLRDWGNHLVSELEDKDAEIEMLEETVSNLESQLTEALEKGESA